MNYWPSNEYTKLNGLANYFMSMLILMFGLSLMGALERDDFQDNCRGYLPFSTEAYDNQEFVSGLHLEGSRLELLLEYFLNKNGQSMAYDELKILIKGFTFEFADEFFLGLNQKQIIDEENKSKFMIFTSNFIKNNPPGSYIIGFSNAHPENEEYNYRTLVWLAKPNGKNIDNPIEYRDRIGYKKSDGSYFIANGPDNLRSFEDLLSVLVFLSVERKFLLSGFVRVSLYYHLKRPPIKFSEKWSPPYESLARLLKKYLDGHLITKEEFKCLNRQVDFRFADMFFSGLEQDKINIWYNKSSFMDLNENLNDYEPGSYIVIFSQDPDEDFHRRNILYRG
jgi:hypothetical protein